MTSNKLKAIDNQHLAFYISSLEAEINGINEKIQNLIKVGANDNILVSIRNLQLCREIMLEQLEQLHACIRESR
jgi:hypothetical protein